MNSPIQVLGVVRDRVRILVRGVDGANPHDLTRAEALALAGQIEDAAQDIPGEEPTPISMRVTV